MAIETTPMNLLLLPQLISNRDLMNTNQGNSYYPYNTQIGSGVHLTTMTESVLPFYQYQAKNSLKSDSGLSYNLPAVPRKRSRDSMEDQQFNSYTVPQNNNDFPQYPSFLGDEISLQIQQNQLEIDHIVAQHTKKLKLELEEREKQHARSLISAIGVGVMKKFKEKEEQIQRISKLNLVLQERVKGLFLENQLWRNLAQTNEATANSLRTNLEHVLAHVSDERISGGGIIGGVAVEEDVESCCGSNDHGKGRDEEEEEGRTLGGEVKDNSRMLCRKCGEKESSVLLLPCRHLCLCNMCGSTLVGACPVCNCNMNATVHVNMS